MTTPKSILLPYLASLVCIHGCATVDSLSRGVGNTIGGITNAADNIFNPPDIQTAGLENLDLVPRESVVILPIQRREALIEAGYNQDDARLAENYNMVFNGIWKNRILSAGLIPHDLELTPELEAIKRPLHDHVLAGGLDPRALENEAYQDARYVVTWIAGFDADQAREIRDGNQVNYAKGMFVADFVVYDPFARSALASMSYKRSISAYKSENELKEASQDAFTHASDLFFKQLKGRVVTE